ncbi:hypothetical protein P1S61_37455 [Streptomyces sp. ME08-AFT2]|uniref:hypothetical protein n=1 Tax=Streptomyces sp. ME08-AFT2 TaxID=3028683 RepID=UPI0029BF7E9D|nr:hypothetical protein [Streptomyces sp. ME08-AFT2]MDX3314644.1 hypothetical protein [Streptomyces sp. ME08-AFT2]
MALPGSGYNPHRVDYFISSDAGVSLSVQGVISTGGNETQMEELMTYLDSALASFGLAYNGGTAYTVIVNKSFAGDTTPTSV